MAKVFGILMIVLGIWIGLEIFTKGMDDAFGGLLTMGGGGTPIESRSVPRASPAQRIGARVQQDLKTGAARSTGGEADSAYEEMDPDDDGGSDEFGSEE